MLASNFNKVHMIPACPCGYQLDIKKSTHKKLSNFLTQMASTGIIKIETNAGDSTFRLSLSTQIILFSQKAFQKLFV